MEKQLEFTANQLKQLTVIPSLFSYTEKAVEYLVATQKEMC